MTIIKLNEFGFVKPHIWFRDGAWECGSTKWLAETRAITPFWAWHGWKLLNDGTVFEAQGGE